MKKLILSLALLLAITSCNTFTKEDIEFKSCKVIKEMNTVGNGYDILTSFVAIRYFDEALQREKWDYYPLNKIPNELLYAKVGDRVC